MTKRLIRLTLIAAVVAAVVAAIRALTRDADPLPSPPKSTSAPWPPLPDRDSEAVEPQRVTPAAPVAAAPPAAPAEPPAARNRPLVAPAWVEPGPDGTCPPGHPIKAKLSSSIFHAPGQMNYDRTAPDRCYASAEAAEADGLRPAKR